MTLHSVTTKALSLFTVAVVATLAACTGDVPDANDDGEPDDVAATTSADALTDSQVSSAYNCAAAGITAIAGAAATVSCGIASLPSAGATVLCYVAGVGTAGAGSLAYCGAQCPGFRNVCPGYKPASFRETSRLVSRCVGTQRYSHWELTDPALIRKYGRSRPEFESGTCRCPPGRTCPTP
ncbi:MAG: hypothetical protein JST00_29530 [Deltaproteobacteria bacterium]|nr:hypothetical protein [Deltaproteobacteria bacterium]